MVIIFKFELAVVGYALTSTATTSLTTSLNLNNLSPGHMLFTAIQEKKFQETENLKNKSKKFKAKQNHIFQHQSQASHEQ